MITEYALLHNASQANTLIANINAIIKPSGTWATPIKHPLREEYLVPIDWSLLEPCKELLAKETKISRLEAEKNGWDFGPFTGIFARERQKLEDANFLLDAIVATYGTPNFPAVRALIHSFLAACYSLKESITNKCESPELSPTLGEWWGDQNKHLERKNELLKVFETFMHTEKHGGPIAGQHSSLQIRPRALIRSLRIKEYPLQVDINTLVVSAEGAFATGFKDTPFERRFPVGVHHANYEIIVINAPTRHLGRDITGASLLDMLSLINKYYSILLFEARRLTGEIKTGAICFDEGQSFGG